MTTELEAKLLEQLLNAMHKPFEKSEVDGHEHDYIPDLELLSQGIVKRKCSKCGYVEPILTVTRLIN